MEKFLDRTDNPYKKSTYIDVKHMDIKARIQYYYFRRKMEQKYHIKIPIIASHFGVSGENQAMAVATGLWPNFDRYRETEDIYDYYDNEILRKDKGPHDSASVHWSDHVMKANGKGYEAYDPLDKFEMAMYKPLNFVHEDSVFNGITFDPFKNYDRGKDTSVGWFYPWSVNLFDEEIIEINKSDGIIGILMDPRQLGAFMPKYRDNIHLFGKMFLDSLKAKVNDTILKRLGLGLKMSDLAGKDGKYAFEYMKAEPLIRNIFYIVRLIKAQRDAELHQSDTLYMREHYPQFIRDDSAAKKDPWDMIAIGSDYDGLIDPVDFAPTAAYIPLLHRRMVVYAYIFSLIHRDQFHLPGSGECFINSLEDSMEKMGKIFYHNGKNFILQYF